MSGSAQQERPTFQRSLVTVLSGQVGSILLALLTEVVYARLLGPEIRGRISLCVMSMTGGVLLGVLGGDMPIIIWAADAKKKHQEWLPASLAWGAFGALLSCSVWAVLYWGVHPQFLKGINNQLAITILCVIPVMVFLGYLIAIVSGLERFRLRAMMGVTQQAVTLSAALIMILFLGRRAEWAVLGYFFGYCCSAAILVYSLRDYLRSAVAAPNFDKEVRAGLVMGLRGQFGNLASFFNYRLDVFIINYFLDPKEVGLYALGVVISESIWQIPNAASAALFPRTARTLEKGATEFTCMVLRQVFLISAVSALAIAVVAPIAIPLVFGARFHPSVAVIWWILPGTVAIALAKVISADLAARYKNYYSATVSVLALVVTVGADWFLIPRMGINGAALASSLAYVLTALLMLLALRHELKVSWKMMLIPTSVEFDLYRQLWIRVRSRLPLAAASANSQAHPNFVRLQVREAQLRCACYDSSELQDEAMRERFEQIKERIARAAEASGRRPAEITLIGVSKTQSASAIQEAFNAGVRHFGENRVQEWEGKRGAVVDLPATWHLIGHLQSNKAAKAAKYFDCVDSVDDFALAQKLDRYRQELEMKKLRVLLEVHLGEESKTGVAETGLPALAEKVVALEHLELAGLMCIPPFLENPMEVRPYFAKLRELRDALEPRLGRKLPVLSMGMSHDFAAAILEGATEVRVGTALFGAREYLK